MNSTIQTTKETELFSKLADTWWDEMGPFKALHAMNPIRMQYMLTHIRSCFSDTDKLKVLDIGCGGGLVCEPFARLGHIVTGVDQSQEAIQIATSHANEQGLNILYHCGDIQDTHETYDVITLLEVLEHVDNPQHLLKAALKLLAPGGLIFFSTLNRTVFSYVAGIWAAENVLKWAPKGAHEWSKFLKPSEIILPLQEGGIEMINVSGVNWSVLRRQWELTSKLNGNYIGVGQLKKGK